MALFKSCSPFSWSRKNECDHYKPCMLTEAIEKFIETGIADIIVASFIGVRLQNTTVIIKDDHPDRRSSSSSSGSSSSGRATGEDEVQGEKSSNICLKEKAAVKVKQVNLGGFGHGFGLREDDIILTVNDKRVESAAMASYHINQAIAVNRNNKLAMEIQRSERGLIRLDNHGDEIELEEIEDDLFCVSCPNQLIVYRIKNLKFRNKYLTVRNGEICLSRHTTKVLETHFTSYQYERFSGETGHDRFMMLKHNATGQCLYVENGELILNAQPKGLTLPQNSGFLFNLKASSNGKYNFPIFFESVVTPGMAIGFEKPFNKAVLLGQSNERVLFNAFEI